MARHRAPRFQGLLAVDEALVPPVAHRLGPAPATTAAPESVTDDGVGGVGGGEPMRLHRVAWEHWGRDFVMDRPRYGSQFYGLVQSGRGRHLRADGEEVELTPGTFFACGGGLPRRHTVTSRRGMKLWLVICGAGTATRRAEAVLGSPNAVLKLDAPKAVATYFRLCLEEARGGPSTGDPGAGDPAVCADLLEILLRKVARQRGAARAETSQRLRTFRRCRGYLVAHAEAGESLADAARACGVHPAYLSRLFKQYEGETAVRFVTRLRLGRALELLESSDRTVQEIAGRCGFDDPYAFSRTFKRLYGLAPLHYRRRALGS